MDRIAADDTPLSHVDEDELHRELEHRTLARKANPRPPKDNARARHAGASPEAREWRQKRAEKREARVHASRDKREQAARRAQEEAFRHAKEEAFRAASSARGQTSARSSARSSAGGSKNRRKKRRSPFQGSDSSIAKHYKTLDLPVGAPFDEVKKSYRTLMRKYHPDRHMGNPKKQKAATELTMRVTQAYKELEDHLKNK